MTISAPSLFINYASHLGYCVSIAALMYATRRYLKNFYAKWLEHTKQKSSIFGQSDLVYLGICSGFLTFLLLTFIGVNLAFSLFSAVSICFFLPRYLSKKRLLKYHEEFDRSLIESLTTVSASLRAGLTLKDSLLVAAKNCPPVFANEVSTALKEYRFGQSLDTALNGIRKRVTTQNAAISFGAMIIANQLGGNLPDILRRISNTVRERERVQGKLRSLTAQGRTQAILLCSAPPVIGFLMYLWDPGKAALLTDTFKGQVLLSLAILLEVIGILVTKKIMRLKI